MSLFQLYALAATGLFSLGIYGFFFQASLIRKVISLNVMGSSVFLLLIAIAFRNRIDFADPVPHAMVLTGIVVAVSTTALGVALARRLEAERGVARLPEDDEVPGDLAG